MINLQILSSVALAWLALMSAGLVMEHFDDSPRRIYLIIYVVLPVLLILAAIWWPR